MLSNPAGGAYLCSLCGRVHIYAYAMIKHAYLGRTHPIVPSSCHEERGVTPVEFEQLKPGLSAEVTAVVDDSLVVKHVGGDGVLSTPSMIGMMERAGIQAVQAILPEGYTTVGFEVNIKHFA